MTSASTRSRHRDGRRSRSCGSWRARSIARTAATWPCGRLRRMRSPAPAGTSDPALEGPLQGLDRGGWQGGERGQRAVLHPGSLAIRLAQQHADVLLALMHTSDSGHVHRATRSPRHARIIASPARMPSTILATSGYPWRRRLTRGSRAHAQQASDTRWKFGLVHLPLRDAREQAKMMRPPGDVGISLVRASPGLVGRGSLGSTGVSPRARVSESSS
jgi:hypothetical protein